jgi:hypothetical protein
MKLDDIKKKNIYTVPDKYFDQLPARIQSRVNDKDPVSAPYWKWVFKLAVPAIAVVFIILYFGKIDRNISQDANAILAQVSTDDIIAYLADIDLSTNEIIESIDFNNLELDFYQESPILQDFEIEDNVLEILTDEYGLDDAIL